MILAIDQGTTGTTCLVFDERAEPIGRAYREFTQHFPQPGWVEHDAREIWAVTQAVAGEALADAGVRPGELAAVGITNQRETVCVWDPATRRAAAPRDRLAGPPHGRALRGAARRRARGARARAHRAGARPVLLGDEDRSGCSSTSTACASARADGTAVFGTIDSWLIFKLTGEHVTDATNASRTLLYDIAAGRWDPELLELFGVPARALPRGAARAPGSSARPAPTALHGHAVPVAGVAGDQQAALFGQACVDPGMAQEHLRHRLVRAAQHRLHRARAAARAAGDGRLGDRPSRAGPTRWRRRSSSPAPPCSGCATGCGSSSAPRRPRRSRRRWTPTTACTSCPALTGLGSPHWDPHARGTIVGLTRGAGRAHLARATLEAIAYQTVDAVRAMEAAAAQPLGELRADGGASANGWLMQFQADVLGVPVVLGEIAETTALGAAYLAGVGVGLWTVSDVRDAWRERARYEPRMGEDERASLLGRLGATRSRARA